MLESHKYFLKVQKSLPYSLQYFIHIFRKHNGTHPTKIHFGGNYRAGWVLAVRRMIRIFLDFISTQRNVRHRRIFIDGVRKHKQHARIPSFGTLKCGYQSYLWKFHTVFSDHQNLKISHMNQIFFSESFGDKQLFSFVSVILVEMNENGEVSLRHSRKLAVSVTIL